LQLEVVLVKYFVLNHEKQFQSVCSCLTVSLLKMLLIKEGKILQRNILYLETVSISCLLKCLMFIPLVLCDQIECVVEDCDWIIYFFIIFFAVYCFFLYCTGMWLPIWQIKLYIKLLNDKRHDITGKCSAVAEMGDRLTTTDVGRNVAGRCRAPFRGWEQGAHLTQYCLDRGLSPYQVAS